MKTQTTNKQEKSINVVITQVKQKIIVRRYE